MDEAVINILDDPMALSMTLKKQYENVQLKNAVLRQAEKDKMVQNEAAGLEIDETPQQSISTDGQDYTIDADTTDMEESKMETV